MYGPEALQFILELQDYAIAKEQNIAAILTAYPALRWNDYTEVDAAGNPFVGNQWSLHCLHHQRRRAALPLSGTVQKDDDGKDGGRLGRTERLVRGEHRHS